MPKIIENLREKLLKEARTQVMELGYSAVNIRTIARNCGVGIGTLYNYFPSKDALIAGFMLQDWMEGIDRIRIILARTAEGDPALIDGIIRELTREISDSEETGGPWEAQESVPSARKYLSLLAIYREIISFSRCYQPLFDSASQTMAAVPRQYHLMLRKQVAELLEPLCPDTFTSEFAAEALITWTMEGKDISQISHLVMKIMSD